MDPLTPKNYTRGEFTLPQGGTQLLGGKLVVLTHWPKKKVEPGGTPAWYHPEQNFGGRPQHGLGWWKNGKKILGGEVPLVQLEPDRAGGGKWWTKVWSFQKLTWKMDFFEIYFTMPHRIQNVKCSIDRQSKGPTHQYLTLWLISPIRAHKRPQKVHFFTKMTYRGYG